MCQVIYVFKPGDTKSSEDRLMCSVRLKVLGNFPPVHE